MDYFVFVGVWLFFTILFWAAVKLNKASKSGMWEKYKDHPVKQQDREPKPVRY